MFFSSAIPLLSKTHLLFLFDYVNCDLMHHLCSAISGTYIPLILKDGVYAVRVQIQGSTQGCL